MATGQGRCWFHAGSWSLDHGWGSDLAVSCRAHGTPSVQDMYTRLLSANLDFDSELQHVFWWAPDECRDSRVFHVDRVFPSSLLNAVSRVWLGFIERYTWVAVFDENTRFSGHGMLFSWIPRRLSCPWYCCCLVDSGGHLLNTWL